MDDFDDFNPLLLVWYLAVSAVVLIALIPLVLFFALTEIGRAHV